MSEAGPPPSPSPSRSALFVAWLPALLYMALIWGLSSFELARVPLDDVPWRDKGIHFVEYGALGFLVAHAVLRTWPNKAWLRTATFAVLVTASWGVLDEMHQAFVPGRSAEVLDVVADFIGAVAGVFARYALSFVWARRTRRQAAPGVSP